MNRVKKYSFDVLSVESLHELEVEQGSVDDGGDCKQEPSTVAPIKSRSRPVSPGRDDDDRHEVRVVAHGEQRHHRRSDDEPVVVDGPGHAPAQAVEGASSRTAMPGTVEICGDPFLVL